MMQHCALDMSSMPSQPVAACMQPACSRPRLPCSVCAASLLACTCIVNTSKQQVSTLPLWSDTQPRHVQPLQPGCRYQPSAPQLRVQHIKHLAALPLL